MPPLEVVHKESINSETWTLTATIEQALDGFHIKLLRIALNYIYPIVISSEKLYTLAKEIPLSQKIKRRRLHLLGHILRLHQDTSAQRALQYYLTPHRRPVGRPPLTWIMDIPHHQRPSKHSPTSQTPITKDSLRKLKTLADNKIL